MTFRPTLAGLIMSVFEFSRRAHVVCNEPTYNTAVDDIGPCHVSGIFLPLRVNSLPLATIYELKIPLRKWKISLLQRNPAQMTWAIVSSARYVPDMI
jgi:hypothetical protein